MEYAAICHKANKRYCYAVEKNQFIVRIRTKRDDVKRIVLHTQDKYLAMRQIDTAETWEMKRVSFDRYHDYFEAQIPMDVVCLRYFFELEGADGVISYYGNHRFYPELIDNQQYMFDCPQNLREEELFQIPGWAQGKVVYQIFPSRFAATADVPKELWYKAPIEAWDELKGNLRGITEHLEYIRNLGADVVYLTPIFQSSSQHKYDTIDYFRIDPDFGTLEDLQELVKRAHELGLRVILDGVFNHTAPEFFAFEDVRKNGENSIYKDWYYIQQFPLRAEYGEKPTYKCFAYFGGMPKLNLGNAETEKYVIEVACYWLRTCGIDGWRLDVGEEVSHRLWKKFREAVRNINPEALLIGETWYYADDFLEGDEWDTIMNYDFYLAVRDFVAEEKMTASQFVETIGFLRGNIHKNVFPIFWNLIDSHDTERFLYACGGRKDKQRFAAALQLLLPGMPMIYYGDEYAMTGAGDPDCRRGMVWDEEYQDQKMYEWYRILLSARHQYPALTHGEITTLFADDETGLITMIAEQDDSCVTVLFHGADGTAEAGAYAGRQDVLTGQSFDGILQPFQTVLLPG